MKKQLDTNAVMTELKAGSAFFKQPEPALESEPTPLGPPYPSTPLLENQAEKLDSKIAESLTDSQSIKQADPQTSNMTILQFSDLEIEELREPAYQAQTFRLTNKEIEWIKDTAYRLSKEVKRGKVSQVDILRIAFKLFDNFLTVNKAELMHILDKIK